MGKRGKFGKTPAQGVGGTAARFWKSNRCPLGNAVTRGPLLGGEETTRARLQRGYPRESKQKEKGGTNGISRAAKKSKEETGGICPIKSSLGGERKKNTVPHELSETPPCLLTKETWVDGPRKS